MQINRVDVEGIFKTFETKDIEKIMNHFADDAVLIDPHYPKIEMKGKEVIRKGLAWGLNGLKSASFTAEKIWIDENNEGAVLLDTHHVFKGGNKVDIKQVFLFAFNADKKITYLQSFVPYRPHGLGGLIPRIVGMFWK